MSFSKKKKETGSKNPIDLFSQLKRADKFQGLIHPQVPLLKKYFEVKDDKNIAIQLTTAGGKTLIGLLIAEWRRRPPLNERVLYLTPTRQLANQVAIEAEQLGIPVVVLQGKFGDYPDSDCRKYTSCKAIAITNYYSFFNQYTRFRDGISDKTLGAPQCLICDDAHAADNIVSKQWSVEIKKYQDPNLYHSILDIFSNYLPNDILEYIQDDSIYNYRSELIPSILTIQNSDRIRRVIKQYITREDHPYLFYPFSQIEEKLNCCQIYISYSKILIRPWISPSWTHAPYNNINQRIFLSATLGENNDLERIFGVYPITHIVPDDEFKGRSVGKRLILSLSSIKEGTIVKNESSFMKNISKIFPKALLLAPTDDHLKAATGIQNLYNEHLIDTHIEESLDMFNDKSEVILMLTRYDGIDLVGCPLLIFWRVPKAVNLQESFLSETLGERNILKMRTRTRIIQGLGRCTRRDLDRTLVLLIGNDFINLLLDQLYIKYFPPQLKVEIESGLRWSEENDYDDILKLINHFKDNTQEWQDAFSEILKETEEEMNDEKINSAEILNLVQQEIDFMKNLWSSGLNDSLENAKILINKLDGNNKLYRAWWNYLAGHVEYMKYDTLKIDDLLDHSLQFFNSCREDSVESAPIWIHTYFDENTFQKISNEKTEQIKNFQLNAKALIIGIDDYEDKDLTLDRCVYDATSVRDILIDPEICGYGSSNVVLLDNSTKQEILTGLNQLIKTSNINSTIFIYFSGHGCHKDGKSFLIPKEYNADNFDDTTISGIEFNELLSKIETKRLVVVLDACHSGGLIGNIGKAKGDKENKPKSGLTKEYIEIISQSRGRFVISSSQEDEVSLILPQYECSLFTHFFCNALRGETGDQQVHDEDGFIRIFQVFTYVSSQIRKHKQIPYFSGHASDYPIALFKGGKIET